MSASRITRVLLHGLTFLALHSACSGGPGGGPGPELSGLSLEGLPAVLDFGRAALVTDAERPVKTVTLTPLDGAATAVVRLEGPDASAFKLGQQWFAGGSVLASLSFSPTEARSYEATLVAHAAGSAGQVQLPLKGVGTSGRARLVARYPSFLPDGSVVMLSVATRLGEVTVPNEQLLRFVPATATLTGLLSPVPSASTPQALGSSYLREQTSTGLVVGLRLNAPSPSVNESLLYRVGLTGGAPEPVFTSAEAWPQMELHGLGVSADGLQVLTSAVYRQPKPTDGSEGTDETQCYVKDLRAGRLLRVGDTGKGAVGCTPLGLSADGATAVLAVDTTKRGLQGGGLELRLVNTTAGGSGTVFKLPENGTPFELRELRAFSPDLSQVAVVTAAKLAAEDPDDTEDLYLVPRTGGAARLLSAGLKSQLREAVGLPPAGGTNLAWSEVRFSRDGTRLSFAGHVNTGYGNPAKKFSTGLYVVELARGEAKLVVRGTSGYQSMDWFHVSSDGKAACWSVQQSLGAGHGTTWWIEYAAAEEWPVTVAAP
ncbi:MAG: hypothetical protein IT371_31040 [Deltaproteobacteria bacterium]|nr:hypothetical protein [Deltaproteobacteria bacterium]